jgi:hypothetical protein
MSILASAEPQCLLFKKLIKPMQDALSGHETHQIVIALPPGDDGEMYSVQVTYSASKPVQEVVLNPFNATATDEEHRQPLNTPLEMVLNNLLNLY